MLTRRLDVLRLLVFHFLASPSRSHAVVVVGPVKKTSMLARCCEVDVAEVTSNCVFLTEVAEVASDVARWTK